MVFATIVGCRTSIIASMKASHTLKYKRSGRYNNAPRHILIDQLTLQKWKKKVNFERKWMKTRVLFFHTETAKSEIWKVNVALNANRWMQWKKNWYCLWIIYKKITKNQPAKWMKFIHISISPSADNSKYAA